MTTPAFTVRDARSIDQMMQAIKLEGWDSDAPSAIGHAPAPMQPENTVAKFLYTMTRTVEGREVVEWLMDVTFRAKFRATGKTFEETALLAATRQGIEGVGEVILAAIQHGAELIEREQEGDAS